MILRFVTLTLWQSPNFVDFFKRDVGFFREIHLWLFENDKHVNCFSVNNTYQKTFFFFFNFKETVIVPGIPSNLFDCHWLTGTFLCKENVSQREFIACFFFFKFHSDQVSRLFCSLGCLLLLFRIPLRICNLS